VRRELFWLGVIGYALIGVALACVFAYGSSEHPVGMVFSFAPIPAFVAFTLALLSASRSKRPLTRIDLARVALWALVGYGFGIAQMAGAYYRHYFPQYADLAMSLGYALAGVCLGLIVVSVLIFPTPKRYSAGCCAVCGYDLTASSGRCPECGAEIPLC